MDSWDIVATEFACSHETTSLAYRIFANGTKHLGQHCQRCGNFAPIKKSSVSAEVERTAPAVDERIKDEWERKRSDRIKGIASEARRQYEERDSEWWDDYKAYMASDEWRSKRAIVMDRDGHLCQACQQRRAEEVHHLTYKHFRHEPLFDLVAVCRVCHEAITNLDRRSITQGSMT